MANAFAPGETIVPDSTSPPDATDAGISGIVGATSNLVGPTGTLTELARKRNSVLDTADTQLDSRLDRDRAERSRAYRAEAAGPDSLPPKWDADAERAKRSRGPMEAFGSTGMIFALAASAFTRAPMTSALKAGAATLEAIHAGDEENYKSAYQAWKDNTELALKRFDMERALFEDANKLATTDINEWRTKQIEIASRFDNKKVLAMLDAGMDKEVIDIQNAQVRGATEMLKARDEFETFDLRHDLLKIEGDEFVKQHPEASQYDVLLHKLQTKEDMMTGKLDIQQQVLKEARQQYWMENGKPMPYDEQAKLVQQMRSLGASAVLTETRQRAQAIDALAKELMKPEAEGGAGLSQADAYIEAEKRVKTESGAMPPSNVALTKFLEENPDATADQIQQLLQKNRGPQTSMPAEIARRAQAYETDPKSPTYKDHAASYDRAAKEVRQANAPPITGTRKEQLEAHIDQYGNSLQTIDKVLNVLETHKGAAGIAGKAMRLSERIGNIAGLSETDRVQMMRDIELLQAVAPQLLLDRTGRPLSAEAARSNDIIAGLNIGDTGPNTVRALKDLKARYEAMRGQAVKRLEGEWTAPPAGSRPGEPSSGAAPKSEPWRNAPIKVPADKRSPPASDDQSTAAPNSAPWRRAGAAPAEVE